MYRSFAFKPKNEGYGKPNQANHLGPQVIRTLSFKGHFETENEREFTKHNIEQRSLVDMIPYPR